MIIENIIDYKDYKPTTDEILDQQKLNEKVEMPALIGIDIYSAINMLEKCGLQFEIQGNREGVVINQFPSSGIKISKNSVVMIEV